MANACCEKMIEESEDEDDDDDSLIPTSILDFGASYRTCICGSTWQRVDAGWEFYQQERKCMVCGHWSCPCCGNYCDSTVDGEGEEIEMCGCDGQCTYAENPEAVRVPDGTTIH